LSIYKFVDLNAMTDAKESCSCIYSGEHFKSSLVG